MPISASNTHNGMLPVADPLILEVQGLRAGYGEIQVLWGIDMAVRRGEITALIGSNGAGKTTLMRALSGLIPMQDGHYFSEGRDLTGNTAAQIRRHERRGQFAHGRLFAQGQPRGNRTRYGAGLHHVSEIAGAPRPGRRDAVRRRAADVRQPPG